MSSLWCERGLRPWRLLQRHWRQIVHFLKRLWERGRGRQAGLWNRGVRCGARSDICAFASTLARYLLATVHPSCDGGHTVEEGVLYAPTQWTVSCDAGGTFGAVSSCYPLKCTVPSLTLSFPSAISPALRRLLSCSTVAEVLAPVTRHWPRRS